MQGSSTLERNSSNERPEINGFSLWIT